MYETIIERIKERLESRDLKAVIIPHISPDGDAAGSCSALGQVLDRVRFRQVLPHEQCGTPASGTEYGCGHG